MGLAICLFFVGGRWLSWKCPFAAMWHTPCPTCGVTRAMRCLMKLDFAGYWRYQPMAAPLCLAVLLVWDMDLFPKKKPVWAFALLIAGGIFSIGDIGYSLHKKERLQMQSLFCRMKQV